MQSIRWRQATVIPGEKILTNHYPTFRSKTIPSWNNERVDRFTVFCGCVGVIASRTRRREAREGGRGMKDSPSRSSRLRVSFQHWE